MNYAYVLENMTKEDKRDNSPLFNLINDFDLDEEHFTLQNTRTDFTNSLFEIPNGITKVRIYIWLEGQDMDGIDTQGDGAFVTVTLNLIKDLAGYRDY